MSKFKPLTQEEINALSPEELEVYNANLATYEAALIDNQGKKVEDLASLKFTELSAIATERGYSFPSNIGKEKLLELMKTPPIAAVKEEKKANQEKKVEKGWATKDGTKFLTFNDAENYARELGGDFVEPKECEL